MKKWGALRKLGQVFTVQGAPCAVVEYWMGSAAGLEPKRPAVVTLHEAVETVRQALGDQMEHVASVGTAEAVDALAKLPAGLAMFLDSVRETACPWLLKRASCFVADRHDPDTIRAWHKNGDMQAQANAMLRLRWDQERLLQAMHDLQEVRTGEEDLDRRLYRFTEAARAWRDDLRANVRKVQTALTVFLARQADGRRFTGAAAALVEEWLMQLGPSLLQEHADWLGVCTPMDWPDARADEEMSRGWADTRMAGRAAMRMVRALLRESRISFGTNAWKARQRSGSVPETLLQAFAPLGHAARTMQEFDCRDLLAEDIGRRRKLALQLARVMRAMTGYVTAHVPVSVGDDGEIMMVEGLVRTRLPGDAWVAGYLDALTD